MKKVTKKAFGILALAILSVPAQAGWLSNLGQRLVHGAANTVQTNISGKVNKAVNDVMDGKVGNQKNNSNTGYNKDTSSEAIQNTGAPTSVSNKSKTNTIKNQKKLEPVSYRGATGKVIPSTGKYELIDLGITKFTGEEIYSNLLKIGEAKKEINEFLEPGYYFICVTPGSTTDPIGFLYDREREGIMFGYGIEVRQKIRDNGQEAMLLGKHEIKYVVQVLPNTQGNIEVTLVNNPKLSGSREIAIFKIPGPTLK